jgi:transcriptional regulator with XRE-family HTH domain
MATQRVSGGGHDAAPWTPSGSASRSALRRRRGWTQSQLATRCGLSQSAVSRLELGEGAAFTVAALVRVVAALGARLRLSVLAHGEDLDRLLDAGHASIVERVAALLRSLGWEVLPEAAFSITGSAARSTCLPSTQPRARCS